MKSQALFSSKDKSKKLKCRLLQFLFGALRIKLQSCFHNIAKQIDIKQKMLFFFFVFVFCHLLIFDLGTRCCC